MGKVEKTVQVLFSSNTYMYNEEVEQGNTPGYQVLHPLLNNRAFFSAMRHSKDITLLHNLIAKGIVNDNTQEKIELVTILQYII